MPLLLLCRYAIIAICHAIAALRRHSRCHIISAAPRLLPPVACHCRYRHTDTMLRHFFFFTSCRALMLDTLLPRAPLIRHAIIVAKVISSPLFFICRFFAADYAALRRVIAAAAFAICYRQQQMSYRVVLHAAIFAGY